MNPMNRKKQEQAISDVVAEPLDPRTLTPDEDKAHLFFYAPYEDYIPLPYTSDLNAMREAEKVLRKPIYPTDSDSVIADRMTDYAELLNYCIDATAAQRAEAFLQTLNLWTNE